MIYFSVDRAQLKRLAGVVAALAILAAAITVFMPNDSVAASASDSGRLLESEEQRLAFFEEKGITVEPSCQVIEARIPKKFDERMQAYADILAEGGYNIEKYRNKTVKKWSYPVVSDEGGAQVYAVLLTHNDKLIAANLTNVTEQSYTPL